jgi:hypothetical protein
MRDLFILFVQVIVTLIASWVQVASVLLSLSPFSSSNNS